LQTKGIGYAWLECARGEEGVVCMECRVCTSSDVFEVFAIPPIPLVGEFTSEPNIEADLFPITVLHCDTCKVLQIKESIDSERLFREYSFSSSTVAGLVKHFSEYASWIWERYKPSKVLEIGCNDGVLLSPLASYGVEVFGLDISENITQLAKSKGLNAQALKFSEENSAKVLAWAGKVDFVTASNTFPHNEDPNGFLEAVTKVLTVDGKLALEVMYSGSLQESLQWDTIYHEHLHFHSLTSLQNLLSRHGFYLEYAEIVPMHAGSLRIIAAKQEQKFTPEVDRILKMELESGLNSRKNWNNFASQCWDSIDMARSMLIERQKFGEIWAYGAAGRATMWIKVARLDFIEKVIDSSPLRAGHFMPGSDMPIVFPNELHGNQSVKTIFVTAWNYAEGIAAQHPEFEGFWSVPLPQYLEFPGKKESGL
jgi:methylation protein EvaC